MAATGLISSTATIRRSITLSLMRTEPMGGARMATCRHSHKSDARLMYSDVSANGGAGATAAELLVKGYVDANGTLHRPGGWLDIDLSSLLGEGKATVGIAVEDSLGLVAPVVIAGTVFSGF